VLKVYEASQKAIAHVRTKSEPFLLEIMTYRFRGHSMGDPERYRKQDEVKKWEESDPIGIFHNNLKLQNVSEAQLNEIDIRVESEIAKAVEFAQASPEPGMDELFKDIYADAD
jgi:pyruvate dehydrogenase E1 component alpha subunit